MTTDQNDKTEKTEKTETAIVIGTNGFVWVAKSVECAGPWVTMNHVRCIRTWGTTKGLNELIKGPTSSTVLDEMAPVISLANHALIAIIPCDNGAWEGKI